MDNFKKNFYFDIRVLLSLKLPFFKRVDLLISKYIALTSVLIFRRGVFAIGASKLRVHTVGDVGTAISSIVDFNDDIINTNIIQKTNPKIVDIGANIGQFSSAAKLFYPNAQIIAFEPDPEVWKLYKSNTAEQTDIAIHNCGLGASKGTFVFYRRDLSGTSSFVSTGPDTSSQEVELPINTLDSYRIKNIDLLKIDVEGYEYAVIAGASKTLPHAKYLLVELSLLRTTDQSNIMLLSTVAKIVKDARIVKFGRPLGNPKTPSCQDVLIQLKVNKLQ